MGKEGTAAPVVNDVAEEVAAQDAAAEAARKELGLEVEDSSKKKEPAQTDEEKAAQVKADADAKKADEAKVAEDKKAEDAKAADEAAKAESKKKEEDDKILATDDKDLDDAQKYQKLQIQKTRDEDKKKQEEVVVADFAKERKITAEEAKTELEHIDKVSNKYGKDAKKIAEAYLNIQRAYTKSQEELKNIQEASKLKSIESMTDDDIIKTYIDTGNVKIKGKSVTKEELIETYKENHPKQTDGANDDQVLYMMANEVRNNLITKKKNFLADMKVNAKDRRIELIDSIPAADKDFIEEVRTVLNNHPDEAVISESFSINDILNWSKGKRYDELRSKTDADIKKSYDEGYKKGKEEAKILGSRAGTPPKTPESHKAVTPSEAGKKEALEMFSTLNVSDEEKCKLYVEAVPESRRAK